MNKLAEKKRSTRITVVAILNIIIGVAYLIVGLFFDSIFNTGWRLFESVNIIGVLVFEGLVLLASACVLWRGKEFTEAFFLILYFFGFVSFAFGPLILLGVVGKIVWRIFIEGTYNGVSPWLPYYFLMELFGFIYSLLIWVFGRETQSKKLP